MCIIPNATKGYTCNAVISNVILSLLHAATDAEGKSCGKQKLTFWECVVFIFLSLLQSVSVHIYFIFSEAELSHSSRNVHSFSLFNNMT